MTAATPPPDRPSAEPAASASASPARRWLALGVLAGSQLLIVLDATIVNVALTQIRADLQLADADLQWVVTGYVLTFGGFLLLGGRLADRLGRRLMFTIGATVFGLASLLAGLAESATMLFAGRALQGTAAAVLAPASLALVMTVFPEGRDRHRALAVWGGVSASGTALGLILGGVLTQLLSWEWVFWVNVPIAALAAAGALLVLPAHRGERGQRFDLAGALLGTAGLTALVYGLAATAENGTSSAPAVLAVAAILLLAFTRLQAVRQHGLLPTHLLRNRTVLGGNLVGLILGAAIYALFYFLSLFLGGTLGYGPIATGLAFLPLALATATGSALAGRLLGRTGARPLLLGSAVLVTVALASLVRISPESTYASVLLPAFLLAGLGLGLAFVALTTAAVGSAPSSDRGVAAAVFNAGQQIGGALGLAVLTAVTAVRTRSLTPHTIAPTPDALTQGWALGFLVSAAIMLLGLTIILTMIRTQQQRP